jgi:GNAT superfamily N-acetyltransferase
MSEITFRTATLDDQAQLLKLLSDRQLESNQLHGGSKSLIPSESERIFQEMIENKTVTILVGEQDQRLVATVTLYFLSRIRTGGTIVIFEDVLVAPDVRGMGVGSKLLTHAIDFCRKIPEVKKIKLGTRKDEVKVHQFYEKLGFEYKENLMQLSL